jgi:molybdopterin-guanine dinucleotide biosynthesis protein A
MDFVQHLGYDVPNIVRRGLTMASFKTFVSAGLLAVFTSFVSTAHADTVGCDRSYTSHDTFKSEQWEQIVKDLEAWKTQHNKHHPYYHTMQRKLVNAERHWKASKGTRHQWSKVRHHRYCKFNVGPD